MAKEFAKKFYKSKEWKDCRKSYIAERRAIDGGLCENCHEKVGYIVHHKIILTPKNIVNPEIALNHKFLSYECKDCHDKHEGHGINQSDEVICAFDEEGNPISILPPFEKNRL